MTDANETTPHAGWQPKPWLAALIGFFGQPLGFLYAGSLRWAGAYLLASVLMALLIGFVIKNPIMMGILALAYRSACAAHCHQYARKKQPSTERPWHSRLHTIAAIFVGLITVIFGIRAFLFEPYRIPSGAMIPSIKIGQHVIISKWGYGNYSSYGLSLMKAPITAPLQRGDLIVFEYPMEPNQSYIKRLVGLPGDTVIYRNKQLTINEDPLVQTPEGDFLVNATMQVFKLYRERVADKSYQIAINASAEAFISERNILDFHFKDQCQYDNTGIVCKVPAGNYFVLGDNRDQSADSRVWGFVPAANIVGKVVYVF